MFLFACFFEFNLLKFKKKEVIKPMNLENKQNDEYQEDKNSATSHNEVDNNKLNENVVNYTTNNSSLENSSDKPINSTNTAEIDQNVFKQNTTVKSNNATIIAPVRTTLQMNIHRLGVIFSNLSYVSILFFVLMFMAGIMLPFLYVINFFVAILISIFTLGLIFLADGFDDLFIIKPNDLSSYGNFVSTAVPILVGVSIISSALALVCLLLDRKNINHGRIVLAAIMVILSIIMFVLHVTGLVEVQFG